ncbi:MAG: aminomethyl-transferring glycine dehydrogenase subunit GcvPB [Spirochaetes bacterium]|nr:aminomethyl-transferring glycine dehydrogenase subunit GcvPB [Spirochaetota bacterium]
MKDPNIIFEKCNNTLSHYCFRIDNEEDKILKIIPDKLLKKKVLNFPDVSENQVIRHFISLSSKNYGVDTGFYPLGSCTMKYNPKINEKISMMSSFLNMHPYSDNNRVQGNLEALYNCKNALLEITGMDDLTFSPCAGAHGEQTGLYTIKSYFLSKGENRHIILSPDSSHGTNPASASMAGFKTVTVKSNEKGFIDIQDLKTKANDDIAAIMLTNPNTLGLFEKEIEEIVKVCRKFDIKLYYDGANLNALLGIARPGDMGFDVVHLNLHKTFSTPHGGGGPGAGPIAVKSELKKFLPGEDIIKKDIFQLIKRGKDSIGKVRSFYANFLVVLKSYVYIYTIGKDGLEKTGLMSLLNANYLAKLIENDFVLMTKDHIMHEFVISLTDICKKYNITVMDFAKRILDYKYHPPTVSFPLIVHDSLMIEPTETENKETLDNFAETIIKILSEAKTDNKLLKNAPLNCIIKRPDDVKAARQPVLRYENK